MKKSERNKELVNDTLKYVMKDGDVIMEGQTINGLDWTEWGQYLVSSLIEDKEDDSEDIVFEPEKENDVNRVCDELVREYMIINREESKVSFREFEFVVFYVIQQVNMDIYVSETTLPYLKNLVNHLKSFSFAILDHDIKESFLMFADMIGDSTSLRYLFMYSADPHRISNVIGEDIGKRVERSVHIVGGNSPLFDMKEMISRNRHNLNVCQTSCETLLAVKKFRRHQTVLGPYLSHDMTNLLGKHLMQTWTDVESWKNCKRQKISYF